MKGFPRRSYYGKGQVRPVRSNTAPKPRPATKGGKPAPKKKLDSFEQEYQKFIADLKAKKAAEDAKKEEQKEEPKVEVKTEPEVIPETVKTVTEEAPILNEETEQKKTRKKKEVVVEPTIEGLD